jgi:hypothetical protein
MELRVEDGGLLPERALDLQGDDLGAKIRKGIGSELSDERRDRMRAGGALIGQ